MVTAGFYLQIILRGLTEKVVKKQTSDRVIAANVRNFNVVTKLQHAE